MATCRVCRWSRVCRVDRVAHGRAGVAGRTMSLSQVDRRRPARKVSPTAGRQRALHACTSLTGCCVARRRTMSSQSFRAPTLACSTTLARSTTRRTAFWRKIATRCPSTFWLCCSRRLTLLCKRWPNNAMTVCLLFCRRSHSCVAVCRFVRRKQIGQHCGQSLQETARLVDAAAGAGAPPHVRVLQPLISLGRPIVYMCDASNRTQPRRQIRLTAKWWRIK